jgi:hypothetical protein
MLRTPSYLVSISLVLGFAMQAFPPAKIDQGLWVQLCSGSFIQLDLGENDTPPMPSHNKACHAVCCQKNDGDSDDSDSDKTA